MEITAETGSQAYRLLLNELLSHGNKESPRGYPTRELTDVTVIIDRASEAHVNHTSRKLNTKIAAAETVQLLAGVSSLEQLDAASHGRFSRFADNGRLVGAYGPRTYYQLGHVVGLLNREPDTRQAYVTIWNGSEQGVKSHDVPCTLGFQFMIRDDKLDMRVSMRSSDVFLGIPYDWTMFSRLQLMVARCLNIVPGRYTHVVGSQHLYERDVPEVYEILDAGVSPEPRTQVAPPLNWTTNWTEPEFRFNSVRQLATRLVLGQLTEQDGRTIGAKWYADRLTTMDGSHVCLACRYVVAGDDRGDADPYLCRECATEKRVTR